MDSKRILIAVFTGALFLFWVGPAFATPVCRSIDVDIWDAACICGSAVSTSPDGTVNFGACSGPSGAGAEGSGTITTSVYIEDSSGQKVKTFVEEEERTPGITNFHWNGTDDAGKQVSTGYYTGVIVRDGIPERRRFFYDDDPKTAPSLEFEAP